VGKAARYYRNRGICDRKVGPFVGLRGYAPSDVHLCPIFQRLLNHFARQLIELIECVLARRRVCD
jgi:hypothetical protein